MKVPKRAQVDAAIRGVRRQLQSTLKAVNQQAGKLMGRGRYEEAEELVRIGRAIDEFQDRVEALRAEWRQVTTSPSGGSQPGKRERTPLWRFYHPIAKVLLAVGGTATLRDLEKELLSFLAGQGPAETPSAVPGTWKSDLRRARRPMIKEGYLEPTRGKTWLLSAEGRRLAGSEPPAE